MLLVSVIETFIATVPLYILCAYWYHSGYWG